MAGMNQRTTPGRHSPLEVVEMPDERDERICPLCGEIGQAHTRAANAIGDGEARRWQSFLMCPRDALPEHGGPRPMADREFTRSLMGVLRTMGGGKLEIRDTADHGFKVDVSGVYFTTPECDEYMAMLEIVINHTPPA